MALVNHCFCCGVPIAAGFFTIYLLIAYLLAFAFELLWILESHITLPAAAILLCAGYFTMALFAALLVHGLLTRTTLCLVAWMFAVTILTFPEAGLVIYMSVQYWRLETLYGLTELICWFVRIIVNVIQLILIQSLFTTWKDEDFLLKSLRETNHVQAVQLERRPSSVLSNNHQYYRNNTFAQSVDSLNSLGMKRMMSSSHVWSSSDVVDNFQYPLENYFFSTQSEFNASIFAPNPSNSEINNGPISKKSQSMLDLRMLNEDNSHLQQYRLNKWNRNTTENNETNKTQQPFSNLSLRMNNSKNIRPKLTKYASVDALDSLDKNNYVIRNRTGFYAQPIENYGVPIYYGPLDGPDFLIYKKQMDKLTSKNSLSNASVDDVQKYRDVAL